MKKTIIGLIIGVMLLPALASASTLTTNQVNSIIAVLQVFGVSQQTIDIVSAELGLSTTEVSPTVIATTTDTSIPTVTWHQHAPIPFTATAGAPIFPISILVDGNANATSSDTILGNDCQSITHTLSVQYSDGSIGKGDVFTIITPDGFNHAKEGEGSGNSATFSFLSNELGQNTGSNYSGLSTIMSGTTTLYVTSDGLNHEFNVTIIDPSTSNSCQ